MQAREVEDIMGEVVEDLVEVVEEDRAIVKVLQPITLLAFKRAQVT